MSLCHATYIPSSMPGFIGTPIVLGTLMSSVSVPAPISRSEAGYSSIRRLKFTMIMWWMTPRGTGWPWPSTSSSSKPRSQPSIGHSKRWIGVSCDMPRSIIAWSSIGGMLGRSKGPAVMTSSLRLESTETETLGSVTACRGSAARRTARIGLHTGMRDSVKRSTALPNHRRATAIARPRAGAQLSPSRRVLSPSAPATSEGREAMSSRIGRTWRALAVCPVAARRRGRAEPHFP